MFFNNYSLCGPSYEAYKPHKKINKQKNNKKFFTNFLHKFFPEVVFMLSDHQNESSRMKLVLVLCKLIVDN